MTDYIFTKLLQEAVNRGVSHEVYLSVYLFASLEYLFLKLNMKGNKREVWIFASADEILGGTKTASPVFVIPLRQGRKSVTSSGLFIYFFLIFLCYFHHFPSLPFRSVALHAFKVPQC